MRRYLKSNESLQDRASPDPTPPPALASRRKRWERDSSPSVWTTFAGAFLGDAPGNQGVRRVKEFAPETRRGYRRQLKVLRTAFGAMGIRSLRPADVQVFLESRPAAVAANRQVALLSRIYTWAERLGLADSNP